MCFNYLTKLSGYMVRPLHTALATVEERGHMAKSIVRALFHRGSIPGTDIPFLLFARLLHHILVST